MVRKVICALDTSDVNEAIATVQKLGRHVRAFKIGHALTLAHGLEVVSRLTDAGAERIFLDLKFHDIPNSVALAVREAAHRGVWMMTVHIAGGAAMMSAAAEETRSFDESNRPLLIGVSVLTSLDQKNLADMGVNRTVEDHMVSLSKLALMNGLDGVVCSPQEVGRLRQEMGRGIIVTPGIRLPSMDVNDQRRTGDALSALKSGADYIVVGRALTNAPDPERTLAAMGLVSA
jgi:orotidine-5'-phosphate decarboxylase